MWNFGTGKTVKRISANEDKTMGNDYIDEIMVSRELERPNLQNTLHLNSGFHMHT